MEGWRTKEDDDDEYNSIDLLRTTISNRETVDDESTRAKQQTKNKRIGVIIQNDSIRKHASRRRMNNTLK